MNSTKKIIAALFELVEEMEEIEKCQEALSKKLEILTERATEHKASLARAFRTGEEDDASSDTRWILVEMKGCKYACRIRPRLTPSSPSFISTNKLDELT